MLGLPNTDELSFSLFINPPCSAVVQWITVGCGWPSFVGKASTYRLEISPTFSLIFTGVKKYEIWRRFQHHSTLTRPHLKMQQDIHVAQGSLKLSFDRRTYIQPDRQIRPKLYITPFRGWSMSYSWVGTR